MKSEIKLYCTCKIVLYLYLWCREILDSSENTKDLLGPRDNFDVSWTIADMHAGWLNFRLGHGMEYELSSDYLAVKT